MAGTAERERKKKKEKGAFLSFMRPFSLSRGKKKKEGEMRGEETEKGRKKGIKRGCGYSVEGKREGEGRKGGGTRKRKKKKEKTSCYLHPSLISLTNKEGKKEERRSREKEGEKRRGRYVEPFQHARHTACSKKKKKKRGDEKRGKGGRGGRGRISVEIPSITFVPPIVDSNREQNRKECKGEKERGGKRNCGNCGNLSYRFIDRGERRGEKKKKEITGQEK